MNYLYHNRLIYLFLAFSLSALSLQAQLMNANGTWTTTTTGNQINITFTPNPANVSCSKIVLVQTVKLDFETAMGMVMTPKPSEVYAGWAYRDDDTQADGTFVDHLFCEKDGGYNGDDPQDNGSQGSASNPPPMATGSTMSDAPRCPDGSFPAGKTKAVWKFETCAICKDGGAQDGMNYGCITWEYSRDKGSSGNGTSSVTSTAVGAPSASFTAAMTAFDNNHTSGGMAICPEELAAGDCTNRFYNVEGPLVFKVNDDYLVLSAGSGVATGTSSPDSSLPSNGISAGDMVGPGTYVYVPPGQRVCLLRTSNPPPPDPEIPFQATFIDLFSADGEITETGSCTDIDHCGIRIRDCADAVTFAAVAPPNITSGPEPLIVFRASINDVDGLVTFTNDLLSTHEVLVHDNINEQTFPLPPGQEMTLAFPELATGCVSEVVPTLSEWGIILFGLLLLAFGSIFIYRQQLSLTYAGSAATAMGRPMMPLWIPAIVGSMPRTVLALLLPVSLLIFLVWGTLTLVDIPGILVSSAILAYMFHYLNFRPEES